MKRELKKINKLNSEKAALETKLDNISSILTSCKLTKRQKESFAKKYDKCRSKLDETRTILDNMFIDYYN